jgi:hypothetical protein
MAMWVYRRMYKLYDYIQDKHFIYLGYIMLVLGAAYGYFTFSEYLTDWFGSENGIARSSINYSASQNMDGGSYLPTWLVYYYRFSLLLFRRQESPG